MTVTIVGLGPGDASCLTRQAWELFASAQTVHLRTNQHPAVKDLPRHLTLHSFDYLYKSAPDFSELYERITSTIIKEAKTANGVIYAVPGHPLVGESTVTSILHVARQEDVKVRIVPGLSFIEQAISALQIDALDGLQLFDAIQIASYIYPPLNTDFPILLGQIYNQLVAGELKLSLMALYPDEHEVVLIHAAGTERQSLERCPLFEIDRSQSIAHLTSLYVPPLTMNSSLSSFAETVALLRSPQGCPWDQEQTRQSLRADFLEEVMEALEALDDDRPEAIQEELGDVLYHLVMQAQIASERNEFSLGEVIAAIDAKLKRRHPHVWGAHEVTGTSDVIRYWEQQKAEESAALGKPYSLLENIPATLPSLARAQKIQTRVQLVGFDWPSIDGVVAKVNEEMMELQNAQDPESASAELGDLLFALVNWARWLGVNAETTLREANRRFQRRFTKMESIAGERKLVLADLDLRELDDLWEESKTSLEEGSSPDK